MSVSPRVARRTTTLRRRRAWPDRTRASAARARAARSCGVDDVVDRARANRRRGGRTSHSGLGPTFTPRITTPMNATDESASSRCTRTIRRRRCPRAGRCIAAGTPAPGLSMCGSASGFPVIAATSRASPRCESRSGRFAPTSTTSRVSPTAAPEEAACPARRRRRAPGCRRAPRRARARAPSTACRRRLRRGSSASRS